MKKIITSGPYISAPLLQTLVNQKGWQHAE